MELKVVERSDDVSHVKLIGKLDVAGMHAVDMKFHGYTAGQGDPCIVDLSDLEFIASLGMGMLISCAQSLQRKDQKMVILNPQKDVETVLKTAGLDNAIPIVKSENEALAKLGVA